MSKYLNPNSMYGKLLCSLQVAAGETAVYTAPDNVSAQISHGTVCNTGGVSVTVSLSAVPAGAVADTTHRVMSAYPLAAGDTIGLRDYLDGLMLGPGDFLSVNPSVGGVVDVVISGAVTS